MINSSGDVNLIELNNAIQYIQEIAGKDAKIMWGTVSSEEQLNDNKNSVITIIATGLENVSASKPIQIRLTTRLTFRNMTRKTFIPAILIFLYLTRLKTMHTKKKLNL